MNVTSTWNPKILYNFQLLFFFFFEILTTQMLHLQKKNIKSRLHLSKYTHAPTYFGSAESYSLTVTFSDAPKGLVDSSQ